MKHLNIEIIAAILDSKIQKKELKKYKNHIDKCDDCMIMYSSIKSNLNESKQHTIEVSDSYKSYIENQLIL